MAFALFLCVSEAGAEMLEVEPKSQTATQQLTLGRTMSSALEPFAVLTAEGWRNVAGGLETGYWANFLADFGFTLELEKLGAWDGSSLFAQFHAVKNSDDDSSFADSTGSFNPVSNIMAQDHFRLFNLYYRQSWREERLVLKLGQLAADDDFMHSDYHNLFLNSAFGSMPTQVGTRLGPCCDFAPAYPIYPVASPGVFFSAKFPERDYLQAGFYYGRPGFDHKTNHGWDWANQGPPELALFWEAAHGYQLGGHPAMLRLGGTYHTGPAEDFAAINRGEFSATQPQTPSFYGVHDLQLLANWKGTPLLGLFLRGGITPDPNTTLVAGYADVGLNWFGMFPGRPEDIAGLGFSWTRFGREFLHAEAFRSPARSESTVELTYLVQVNKRLSLQPDLQFLIDPLPQSDTGVRKTAVVLGIRGRVIF